MNLLHLRIETKGVGVRRVKDPARMARVETTLQRRPRLWSHGRRGEVSWRSFWCGRDCLAAASGFLSSRRRIFWRLP